MKNALLILLLAVAHVAAAQSVRSITLAWDAYPDSVTNYVYKVYSTNVVTAPMPWPLVTSVTGALTASFSISMTPGVSQYFYITGTDLRSNPTNYIIESDPSVVVSAKLLPSGSLRIGKGP